VSRVLPSVFTAFTSVSFTSTSVPAAFTRVNVTFTSVYAAFTSVCRTFTAVSATQTEVSATFSDGFPASNQEYWTRAAAAITPALHHGLLVEGGQTTDDLHGFDADADDCRSLSSARRIAD